MSVSLLASGEGAKLNSICLARINWSLGLWAYFFWDAVSFGAASRLIGFSDQCCSHLAPWLIHWRRVWICEGLSFLPLLGGGMISSGSLLEMRLSSSFNTGRTVFSLSRRNFAFRASASGP